MPTTIPQPPKRKTHHVSKMAREADTAADELSAGDQGDPASLLPMSEPPTAVWDAPAQLATLEARDITAWFGDHMVLDQVSLTMQAGEVTALIGPSGCGKSTFLRILNRMHQLVPGASLAGEVLLDGVDIYDPSVSGSPRPAVTSAWCSRSPTRSRRCPSTTTWWRA